MNGPKIGQRATFFPGGGLSPVQGAVERVWGPHCVNLVLDQPVQPGGQTLMTSVLVYESDRQRPSGYYCTLAGADEKLPASQSGLVNTPAPVTASIKGYRQLTPADQALINECKELSEKCGAMVARLRAMQPSPPSGPTMASPSLADPLGKNTTIDQRWVSIGATHLQEGWMAIVRGIAQPSTF